MLEIDDREIRAVRKKLEKAQGEAGKVISQSLNKATTVLKKQLPDVVESIYSLGDDSNGTPRSKGLIKTSRAKEGKLSSILKIKSGSMPLNHFKHFIGKDVYVRVKGEDKLVKDAFGANVHGVKIFKRKADVARLPIDKLFSTPIASMFRNEEVLKKADELSVAEYEKALLKGIDKAIKNSMGG